MRPRAPVKCSECKTQTYDCVLLPASTWYFIFDHDSSKENMLPGWGWPIQKVTREVWEMARAKRDTYSPVYGKIFKCWIPYCKDCMMPKRKVAC